MKNVTNTKYRLGRVATLVVGGSLLFASVGFAQQATQPQQNAATTARDGIERIKGNLGNSKANLGDYQKNSKTVDKNIGEIGKARTQLDEQRKMVLGQLDENTKSLKKVEQNEKDLQVLIADEKAKKAQEEKKLQELQNLLTKLQENVQKRDSNLTNYETQLSQIQEDKKIWANRGDQIKQQATQVDQKNKALTATENDWRNKKKTYDAEVQRWSKEVDRQQKLYDNYSSLAEVRD